MIIEFEKDYLSDLYYNGQTNNSKLWFQPAVVKKYIKTVDLLESLSRIEDLYRYNSLNYEALSGDMKGLESVRVTEKYRLEFISRKEGEKDCITVCKLIDLSNHYQ